MGKRLRWHAALVGALCALAACREQGLVPIDRERDAVRPKEEGTGQPATPLLELCPPACPPPPARVLARQPAPNPIPAENKKPGEPLWRAGRQANAGQIELYLSTDSAAAGEKVGVRVSTDGPQAITAEVFRLGYYGGAGARRVWSGGPFEAGKQAACPRDPHTSRVECNWPDTFTLSVGADWLSGIYLVKLRRADGFKRFAPLVVRDGRAAEILFQPAFNTYQAYNGWGGESLYEDGSRTMPSGMAWEVSYDRPYKDDEGSGQVLRWELPFTRFLEQHGYDVTYATNLDFERFGDVLNGIGAFVHAGHDEYWSAAQRAQVDAALATGRMSLAYFGGNGAYWRVRPVSNGAGAALRTLVCFKADVVSDPSPGSTVRFRDPPNPHPESLLFGAMYEGWQLVPFPLTVADERHWLFEGTGLKNGTQLPGLVGYEYDRIVDEAAPREGLSIPFDSPLITAEGLPSRSHAVARTLPSGRLAFSAGTIFWPLGLADNPETRDGRVERMTLNVLERALAHRRPMRALPPAAGPIPAQPTPDGRWAGVVSAFAGAGAAGYADGPAATARFNGPTGLATTLSSEVVVADTNNNRVRLIRADPQRTVITLAGNGLSGARDGAGAQAMFRSPTGVAVAADGTVYVADSDNHVIRRIENNPPTYTVTTYAGAFRKQGFADGAPDVARFKRPTALALDALGNLYVADQAGNRIRLIAAGSRQVMTLAGNGSAGVTDAPSGALAAFNNPSAIAVGKGGEVYVLDAGNQRVRRIAAGGARAVTTLAGRPDDSFGYADGSGEAARFRAQLGLTLAEHGELLVADTANFRIRKVLPGADAASTVVFTYAGSGRQGTKLGPASDADLVAPAGLAYLPSGDLLVSDSYNNAIRAISR